MPLKTTLRLEDKDYPLLELSYRFDQKFRSNGLPNGGVLGGRVRLIVEGQDNDVFISWATDPKKTLDGKITMVQDENLGTFKTVEFKQAYIVKFWERFLDSNFTPEPFTRPEDWVIAEDLLFGMMHRTGNSYVTYCEISAASISVDSADHDNKW
jgi:hypothetical protein